jgi:hypothetical protein
VYGWLPSQSINFAKTWNFWRHGTWSESKYLQSEFLEKILAIPTSMIASYLLTSQLTSICDWYACALLWHLPYIRHLSFAKFPEIQLWLLTLEIPLPNFITNSQDAIINCKFSQIKFLALMKEHLEISPTPKLGHGAEAPNLDLTFSFGQVHFPATPISFYSLLCLTSSDCKSHQTHLTYLG